MHPVARRIARYAARGAAVVGLVLLSFAALALVFRLLWSVTDAPPEAATGWRDVSEARGELVMIAAAHPAAVEAGLAVLRAGGTAMDAAVAVQLALNVVEPQSSGIGGGAFLLYWDAASRTLHAYDGRETAPALARGDLFLRPNGEPWPPYEAMIGGRPVGTPGLLRLLELAHKAHGRVPWSELFTGPIALAKQGFLVSPRLHLLARWDPVLPAMAGARQLFYEPSGRALAPGATLRNPELAAVFEELAAGGPAVFYEGPIARDIVQAVTGALRPSTPVAAINYALTVGLGAPRGLDVGATVPCPGLLSETDLRTYTAKERTPLCVPYRRWRVCGMPPPTSGSLAVLQILGMLSHFELGGLSPTSPQAAHLLAEAERLAFADRDAYVADPDFVDVPTEALLRDSYLQQRAGLIRLDQAAATASPGAVQGKLGAAGGWSPELPSTSHFSIFDAEGNVVSMTTSIENVFGSQLLVRGFLLNNQLTDFSFVPEKAGAPVANALAPGKRPRSSMAPLIVFDAQSGDPVLALGSPGGSRIIAYVAQAVVGMLDWGLGPQQAVSLPHVVNRNSPTELEDRAWAPGEREAVEVALEALGHQVQVAEANSGLHAVQRTPAGLRGGADPRRDGVAGGW